MGRQAQAHVLMIAAPGQRYVAPLMKLEQRISDHNIKFTFVNSDFIHEIVVAALLDEAVARGRIRLVSIPDGLDPEDEGRDTTKLLGSIERVMPGHLTNLIEKVNISDEQMQITCVISEIILGRWPMEVAEKMGIQ